jgi:hypothetical protein
LVDFKLPDIDGTELLLKMAVEPETSRLSSQAFPVKKWEKSR